MLKLLKKPAKKIMLIEDDEFDHNMLRDFLIAKGFVIISVRDAKNAEERLELDKPDAVFTALMLNDMVNGSDLVERMRCRENLNIPIIGMSSQVNNDADYFYSICDHALHKPLSIAAINKVISQVF